MDIYSHSTQRQYTNLASRYEKLKTADVQEEGGDICTTKEAANGIVSIVSHSPPAPQQTKPSSWLEVLGEWGYTWMWSNLQSVGEDDWLERAIRTPPSWQSLTAHTLKSYILICAQQHS